MIKKNIAYTHNYKDSVKLIGNDLIDEVLSKYPLTAESNKNATYMTTNTAKQFVNVIGNWKRENNLQTIKTCNYLTLMLDETTDESNHSEFRIVNTA